MECNDTMEHYIFSDVEQYVRASLISCFVVWTLNGQDIIVRLYFPIGGIRIICSEQLKTLKSRAPEIVLFIKRNLGAVKMGPLGLILWTHFGTNMTKLLAGPILGFCVQAHACHWELIKLSLLFITNQQSLDSNLLVRWTSGHQKHNSWFHIKEATNNTEYTISKTLHISHTNVPNTGNNASVGKHQHLIPSNGFRPSPDFSFKPEKTGKTELSNGIDWDKTLLSSKYLLI